VRKLSFTGSTEVGRGLLRVAADNVISCSMELGGNAPVIVCADADLDAAVAGTMVAKMRNGGEACTAANRIYVHRSIAQEFSRRLAVAMDRISVGSGLNRSVELGPLINQAALEKVDSLVGDAITHGAHVVTGGQRLGREGFFYPPTVLTDVPADARLLQEEIFGPVAPVIAFEHVEDVIAAANETPYGLVAYVFTQDLAQGLRIAERLETGMVGLNRGVVSDPAAPFGGVKQSGLGREGAHEGILEFTEAKYIATLW
jgi:succinate-semialdehyde dehydrogenase/glutarate-semialdehyde dehydrogenase